jgi:N-methylhydantoinase A
MAADWQVAVDIGGTFTDILLVDRDSGAFAIHKLLTTSADPAEGVHTGLAAVVERSGLRAEEVGTVVHATTLVTNAVIERKGARVALLVTEGFRDMLTVGREHRYDMYDLLLQKPEPLVAPWDTFAVPERVLVDGSVHRPLDEEAVESIAAELSVRGIDAAAICLLHAYRNPRHELRIREILQTRWPGSHITLSHEVVGELREYERGSTTVANAYVLALVDRYLSRLEDGLAAVGHVGRMLVMLSSGGVATTSTARAFPVRLIESGPAAGALAAAEAGKRIGQLDLLSFDMGGTTAKACIIAGGRPTVANSLEVGRLRRFRRGSGIPLEISSVELIEIGAGGGSLARIDRFGLLQVGPDSAGSDPGPMCYGMGGRIPTVTDADLVLGYLSPTFFLGGRIQLDAAAATRGIETELAGELGLETARAAWTVHEVVNENMANAARVHAVEAGADLRRLPLFAFGGAGPVHAYRVAMNLGMELVIAPLGAGVGSTIGLLAAPLTFDFVRTMVMPLANLDWSVVGDLLSEMESDGTALLHDAGVLKGDIGVEIAADMRLAGQAHEITVALGASCPEQGGEGRIRQAFDETYQALFGRQPPHVMAEVVSWRVRVYGPRPSYPIHTSSAAARTPASNTALKGSRNAYFPEADGFVETAVYDRYLLLPGMTFEGPAIIEERESTLIVGPGGRVTVDEFQNLLVEVPS